MAEQEQQDIRTAPAFPLHQGDVWGGMGMRHYFAAAALSSGQCPYNSYEHEKRAEWAIGEADALLAAFENRRMDQ